MGTALGVEMSMAVPDLARRSSMELTARRTVIGGLEEARLCSSSLVVRWLASVKVVAKECFRVKGLTRPSGDG